MTPTNDSTLTYRDAAFRAQRLTTAHEAIVLLQEARANEDLTLVDAIKAEAKYQGWPLKADTFEQSSTSVGETATVLDQLKAALRTADAFTDANLTAQALNDTRHTMRAEAKATAQAAIQQIHKATADAANRAHAIADPFRPKLNPDDQVQILRTEQAWRINVLPQLEAGKPWSTILTTLDEDSALGVERFARSWLTVNREPMSNIDGELDAVIAGIHTRHADIVTDPIGREAITAANTAAELFNGINNIAAHVHQARTISDLTMASIAMQHMTSAVGAGGGEA